MATAMVSPSGAKRKRETPVKKSTNTKTITVVTVEASTGAATSRAPSSAACSADFPSRWWRWTFSSTTMASSTSRPTARDSPPRVKTLRVWPLR